MANSLFRNTPIARNTVIDFYLANMRWRDRTWSDLSLAGLIMMNNALMVTKHSVIVLANLSKHDRLLLFDLASMLGGLPKYNTIFLLGLYLLSIHLNRKFHIKKQKNVEEGVILMKINEMNGRKNLKKEGFNIFSDASASSLRKLIKRLYKGLNISIATFRKFFLSQDYCYRLRVKDFRSLVVIMGPNKDLTQGNHNFRRDLGDPFNR